MDSVYVFDMGSVLKRPFEFFRFYTELACEISFEDFKNYWYSILESAEKGKITSKQFLNMIKEYSKSAKTLDEIIKIYKDCTNTIYENTLNIIYNLKSHNKKVYLLSDLKEIDYESLKEKIDINIFDKLFLSYKLGYTKRDKEIFKIVIDDLNVNPSLIYFFDDRESNIENAKEMGINAYLVTGENIKEKINIF